MPMKDRPIHWEFPSSPIWLCFSSSFRVSCFYLDSLRVYVYVQASMRYACVCDTLCVCSSKWFLWFSWMFIFLVQELSSSIKLTRDWKLPFLQQAQSRPWHPDENPPQKAGKFISENVFLSANLLPVKPHGFSWYLMVFPISTLPCNWIYTTSVQGAVGPQHRILFL